MNLTHETLYSELKEAGVDSELFWLNKRWCALKVFGRVANQWFWVRRSSRGWLLGDKDVFQVPDSTSILDVCIECARDLESRRNTIHSFGLELRTSWMRDENEYEHKIWESAGWDRLSDSEGEKVCDGFENKFAYPGDNFPSPSHSKVWDFSFLYDCDLNTFECSSAQLNLASLTALRQCLAKSEDLFALDWNNTCYRLDGTNGNLNTGSSEMWPISVFPNDDYHMFVTADYRLGVLGDPGGLVCAYGDQMPQNMTLELGKTTLTAKVVREKI